MREDYRTRPDIRRIYARFIEDKLQPNVAVTATLSQSRSYLNDRGKSWRDVDSILLEGVLKGLGNRLSKTTLGKSHRRFGKCLLIGGAIEGDGCSEAFHLHAFIQRPHWLDSVIFETQVRDVWLQSPWLKPDLDIQEIRSSWVFYTLKRGPEALLLP